jgi:hypothetical protein
MPRGGRGRSFVVTKKRPIPGGSGGVYSETFSAGTVPSGYNGGHWTGGQTVDATRLSIVSGKLRVTGDNTHIFPHALKAIGQMQSGSAVSFSADYAASATAAPSVGLSANADGSTAFLSASGLTTGSSGTATASGTVPSGNPTVYLVLYDNNNSAATETVDFDNIVVNYTPYTGGGGGGGTPVGGFPTGFVSSRYITSYAGRGRTVRHKLDSQDPATYAIVPDPSGGATYDNAEFTLTGNILSHPTGADGKQVMIRATRTSDSAVNYLLHTCKQKAATANASGILSTIYYTAWSDNWPTSSMDYSNADLWNLFSIRMKTDGSGQLDTSSAAYWGYGMSWPLDAVTRIHTAGKKAILVFAGGGTWGDVYWALSDDTKRLALANALLAEMDRIGADGIDLDMEKNATYTDQEWLWMMDLSRMLREARPTMYLTAAISGVGVQMGADASSDLIRQATLAGYWDHGMLMTYIMAQSGDPSHLTWYNTPIRGATPSGHRTDLTETIRQHANNNVFPDKLGIGGGGFVTWWNGPTAPDQFDYDSVNHVGRMHSVDTVLHQREWVESGTFGKFFSGLTKHFDVQRKASWGRINPAASGTGDSGMDGATYVSWYRDKDYAEYRKFAQDNGLVMVGFWQTVHTSVTAHFAEFHGAVTTNSPAASADPSYTTGTSVYSNTFPTDGNAPAGFSSYAGIGATVWVGPDATITPVVSGRMQFDTTTSPVKRYPTTFWTLTGLTVGQCYALSFDLTSSSAAKPNAGRTNGESASFAAGTTNSTAVFVFFAISTSEEISIGNGADGVASTMSVDNLNVREVAWDTVG